MEIGKTYYAHLTGAGNPICTLQFFNRPPSFARITGAKGLHLLRGRLRPTLRAH